MSSKTEKELINEFRNGDERGFNELVQRYQERIYRICRRIVGTHEEADDLVQETFIRAYKGLRTFRDDASFFTWIYRIATNTSLNALRKKKIMEFLRYDDLLHYEQAPESPDAPLLSDEYHEILRKAIDALPPKQKMVFIMRFYEELPYEDMAKIFKRSVGGVKANYSLAFLKIRTYIRKEMKA